MCWLGDVRLLENEYLTLPTVSTSKPWRTIPVNQASMQVWSPWLWRSLLSGQNKNRPLAIFCAFQPDGHSSHFLVGQRVQANLPKLYSYQYSLDADIYSHYSLLEDYPAYFFTSKTSWQRSFVLVLAGRSIIRQLAVGFSQPNTVVHSVSVLVSQATPSRSD